MFLLLFYLVLVFVFCYFFYLSSYISCKMTKSICLLRSKRYDTITFSFLNSRQNLFAHYYEYESSWFHFSIFLLIFFFSFYLRITTKLVSFKYVFSILHCTLYILSVFIRVHYHISIFHKLTALCIIT